MPRRDSLLTFCILFAVLFHAGDGVEGGIKRKSVLRGDDNFIRSISEQLYGVVESRDEEEDNEKKIVKDERKKREDEGGGGAGAGGGEGEGGRGAGEMSSNKNIIQRNQGSRSDGNGATPTPEAHDGGAVPLVAAGADSGNHRLHMIILIAGCCVVGVVVLVLATACFVQHRNKKVQTRTVPYMPTPIYEFQTVPSAYNNNSSPDYSNALAYSAQKFHYQHEKEKIIAMEKEKSQMEPSSNLSVDCTEEVFETPGLASMWDFDVENPVYNEGVTPGTTPRDHTPMWRNHTPTSIGSGDGEENGEDGGKQSGNFNHINGNAADLPLITNGSKSNVHLEIDNEASTPDSNDVDVNANSITADADHDASTTNGINGVNGYHD